MVAFLKAVLEMRYDWSIHCQNLRAVLIESVDRDMFWGCLFRRIGQPGDNLVHLRRQYDGGWKRKGPCGGNSSQPLLQEFVAKAPGNKKHCAGNYDHLNSGKKPSEKQISIFRGYFHSRVLGWPPCAALRCDLRFVWLPRTRCLKTSGAPGTSPSMP
jgi:hypothetical protein